jgi:hypothetical protein
MQNTCILKYYKKEYSDTIPYSAHQHEFAQTTESVAHNKRHNPDNPDLQPVRPAKIHTQISYCKIYSRLAEKRQHQTSFSALFLKRRCTNENDCNIVIILRTRQNIGFISPTPFVPKPNQKQRTQDCCARKPITKKPLIPPFVE